jgi:hypothetical protein
MGLKDMWHRMSCARGFHEGTWQPTSRRPCEMTRSCPWCGQVDSTFVHKFTQYTYSQSPDDGPCVMGRSCADCGTTEAETLHRFELRHTGRGCDYQEVCSRCSARGSVRQEHEWGGWFPVPTYETGAAAPQLQQNCLRCGKFERR